MGRVALLGLLSCCLLAQAGTHEGQLKPETHIQNQGDQTSTNNFFQNSYVEQHSTAIKVVGVVSLTCIMVPIIVVAFVRHMRNKLSDAENDDHATKQRRALLLEIMD